MNSKVKMKKYLGKVLELETEKHRLEELKEKLSSTNQSYNREIEKEENISYKGLEFKRDRQITQISYNHRLKEPVRPTKPKKQKIISKNTFISIFLGIFVIAVGVCFESTFFIGIGCILTGVLLIGFISQFFINKQYNANVRNYENQLVAYYQDLKKYQKDLENESIISEQESQKLREKYDKEIKTKKEASNIKKHNIKLLIKENQELMKNVDDNLVIVNDKLKKLYDLDIIFEKYRSLIPVSSFYEYFASSRVESLEGRDGAYNLYELELRQNIIIAQLIQINKNLDKIKQNQYCLYKGLSYINDSINEVNDHLYDIKVLALASTIELVSLVDCAKDISKVQKEINRNIGSIKEISASEFLYK